MHPIIFTFPESIPIIGGANIYSYGVMMGLSFISAWYLGLHFTNRENLPYKNVVTAFGLAIIFSLIGARIAHLLTNPHTWRMHGFFPALFTSKCEGLVAYGGYIGGNLAALVYFKMKKLDFWSLADCTTPSMVLGLGFTRIGCFLAGCCHGQPTDLPWAITFPAGSQASHVFPHAAGHSLPVHPTQLYESLVGFALVPLGLWLVKHRKFTGQAFLIIIPCYALARFMLEFIRGDSDRGGFGNHAAPTLSTSQFIGLMLIPVVIALYFYRRKNAPVPPVPLSTEEVELNLIEAGVIKKKEQGESKPAKSKKSPKGRSSRKKS